MFVNGTEFLIISERNITFATIDNITIWTADQPIKILNKVIKLYGQGGFVICVTLMDMEV